MSNVYQFPERRLSLPLKIEYRYNGEEIGWSYVDQKDVLNITDDEDDLMLMVLLAAA
jgi:hypothetical protein